MRTRILPIVLTLAAAAASAGGCGSDTGDSSGTSTAQTTTPATATTDEELPPIAVETPEDFDVVVRRLRIQGDASVFEGNVRWQVKQGEHDVVAEGFTTAECGAPCRGPFSVDTSLVNQVKPGNYVLEVFGDDPSGGEEGGERNGDGRVGLVQIPFAFYLQPEAPGPEEGASGGGDQLDVPPPPPE